MAVSRAEHHAPALSLRCPSGAALVTPTTSYCTILATNYLPRALSLADSLRRHHPESPLVVLITEALTDDDLPDLPGVRLVSLSVLGLPERAVLELAAGYDLVEFATAVKPLLLKALLDETDQAVYLDPDTYVTAPMEELTPALQASAGGIVLTPHYLEPTPEASDASEGHLLSVGVFNLGFCAVDRRAGGFLDWWWGHLKHECLHDPLSGLFVDQKWVDIGSTLFSATALQHYGYNVGISNLHERPLDLDTDGYYVASSGDRLRLFHFHSFDTSAPNELSRRFDTSSAHLRPKGTPVDLLCTQYASVLSGHERDLDLGGPYRWAADTSGRRIARPTRRVYRRQLAEHAAVPSPFVASEAKAYDAWRRSAWRHVTRDLVGDAAKALRCALPDEYARAKQRFPRVAGRLRSRYVDSNGIWG